MINIENLNPFPKFCCSIGMIPTSYKVSYTYEEQLLWFCDFLENTVIPTVNNNGQAVEELQNLFVTLTNYVNNYFDNLDVQTEINNKLDEMAESGVLEEIINSYLQIKSLITFDTVNDMKNSTNLVNGSFAKTLGFYTLNDGGSSLYKIRNVTNNDVIDNILIISINNNLVAELIYNQSINIKQFGAYGDGIHDDTVSLQKALDFAYHLTNASNYNSLKVFMPKGKYLISDGLNLTSSSLNGSELSNIMIEGEGQGATVIITNFVENENAIFLNASSKFTLKNLSFKNISNNNVDVTAIKISGSSMLIDLENIFVYNFYVGFDVSICVGSIKNCFANSCNCGFKVYGTSTNLINCYASQCNIKHSNVDYDGCGYYLNTLYSVLEACASDSNTTAYYIIKNGITLLNCGMEGDTNGIVINTPNSNVYEAPIVINGFLFDNISKPTIKILKAQKVIIENHNFSLDYDYVQISDNLPTNVVEYRNCNFYISNETLYPSNILIPLNNRAREKGLIYNFDGFINEGKARIYGRTLKWRIPKNDNSLFTNGRQIGLFIKIRTIRQYTDQQITSCNEEFAVNYTVSSNYLAKTLPKYNDTIFTYTRTSDSDYYYFELTPINNTVIPDNNVLCFDINVTDNTKFDLNNGRNLIKFNTLDYNE